jgi:hypothetical protein
MLLVLRVVLLPVDPPALAILLAIDLAPFLGGERSTIRLPIAFDFVMNRSFSVLQVRCLTRRERTVLHAFPDPFLLVPLAIVNLVLRQNVAHATQHATQQQRTRHHACHYAFHVQPSFRLQLSAVSGLLNEAHVQKV